MTKTTLTITLDTKVKNKLELRAKKELLSVEDLIADILRRSIVSYKGNSVIDKVDDKFLTFFSRKQNKTLRKK